MLKAIRRKTSSTRLLGAGVLLAVVAAFVTVYQKDTIGVALRAGDIVRAEFAHKPKVVADNSKVKVADVVVGTVSGLEERPDGRTIVSMKVDEGVVDKLGSAPSARVRATTLLGGNYYVDLRPSGDGAPFGGETIPAERTGVPVELDQVLSAIPSDAQQGLRSMTRQLDKTLAAGGQESLEDLVRDAPAALRPAASVLEAARGNEPTRDLTRLVTDVQGLASALTEKDGQLESIVTGLSSAGATLAEKRRPVADTVSRLPETLSSARAGLGALSGTLRRLEDVAGETRPVVRELGPVVV